MSWNYRVVKRTYKEEVTYSIHEAYYNYTGNVDMISENPIAPIGETIEELEEDMKHYRAAMNKPVINYEDIGASKDAVDND